MRQFQGMKPLMRDHIYSICSLAAALTPQAFPSTKMVPTCQPCVERRNAAGILTEQSQCRQLIFDP